MSYYWFNRKELLKKYMKNIIRKVAKKNLLVIIKKIKRLYKKEKETSTE